MKKRKNNHLFRSEVKPETAASPTIAVDNRIAWIFALIVVFITFLVYLPTLNNGFVNWDDSVYVYENYNIRSLDLKFFKWAFTSEIAGLWHPMTMFSLAINYAAGGYNPWGYHLFNNLLHSLNTFLIFILTIQLIRRPGIKASDKTLFIVATVTSLLFGVHPLHVESVAWVSERKDVLSAFFYLLCLLAYLKYTSALNPKRYIFYSVCLTSFILAIMSKPMAVSLPLVLVILDFYPLERLTFEKRLKGAKYILIEKLPFFMLSLLSSVATIWGHYLEDALSIIDKVPISYRALIAVRAYIFYLVKMVIPLNLAPLYLFPPKINPFDIEYLGAVK